MLGMAHADVTEGVDDALVGNDVIGECELRASFGEAIGHGFSLSKHG
jgi:hypothetical protein